MEPTDQRSMHRVGDHVQSAVLVTPYRRQILEELLDELERLNISEFAIDFIVSHEKLYIDSESRNYRRIRGWTLPNAGSELMDDSYALALNLYLKTIEEMTLNALGAFQAEEHYRFTIELTHQDAGKNARAYDSVPHIDALIPYLDDPITEILWSDAASSIIFEGEYVWKDTTGFNQDTSGLTRLKIPKRHLEIGNGATLIHCAPPGDMERWLLRAFMEPISRSFANECRYGHDDDFHL